MSTKLIPLSWLPAARARRVILHWTAGGPTPSDLDLGHYHFLVDRRGKVCRGEHTVTDNDVTSDDDYAAHTRGANTGAIGVALCGMAGAVQRPFKPGPYPITRKQWNAALIACADLCRRYGLTPDERSLLMHSEVEECLGIPQRGKWDVDVRTWPSPGWEHMTPGQELRARVALLLKETS